MPANDAQIMWGIETTGGLIVTPTAANPLISESLSITRNRIESGGIIANRNVITSNQWGVGNIEAGGDIALELYNRGLGKLLRACFGTVNTTGAGPYEHVYTLGATDDDVLTVQVGLPPTFGSVVPKTLGGCAVSSWEMAGTQGEIVTFGATLAAMNGHIGSRAAADGVTNTTTTVTSATLVFGEGDVGKPITGTGIPVGTHIARVNSATSVILSAAATATATGITFTVGTPLATATYLAAQRPINYTMGTVSLFGARPAVCKSWTFGCEQPLADDRFNAGEQTRGLPIVSGLREVTGTVELEFESVAQWDRYANASEGALSLAFVIPGSTDTLTLAGNVRYDMETPSVGGRGLTMQNIPVKFVASGADSTAISMTLSNSDVTP